MLRKEIKVQPVSNYYDCMMHSRSNLKKEKQNKTWKKKKKKEKNRLSAFWLVNTLKLSLEKPSK